MNEIFFRASPLQEMNSLLETKTVASLYLLQYSSVYRVHIVTLVPTKKKNSVGKMLQDFNPLHPRGISFHAIWHDFGRSQLRFSKPSVLSTLIIQETLGQLNILYFLLNFPR